MTHHQLVWAGLVAVVMTGAVADRRSSSGVLGGPRCRITTLRGAAGGVLHGSGSTSRVVLRGSCTRRFILRCSRGAAGHLDGPLSSDWLLFTRDGSLSRHREPWSLAARLFGHLGQSRSIKLVAT